MSPGTSTSRRAVIDVGTNSVKLLVADVTGDVISPVLEIGEQTRLGRGFYETRVLQEEAIALTATVIARFGQQARKLGATGVRPFATSAARDARNVAALTSSIRAASGCELTVISGDTEAEWAFRGAASNPVLGGRLLLLIDVGGGSTECILGQGGQRHFSRSYPLGTVRTLEALPHGDPPTPAELAAYRHQIGDFIRDEIQPELGSALEQERLGSGSVAMLAATGGTASILAMMEAELAEFDRERIEAMQLTDTIVSRWVERLWGMPLAERRQLPGLPAPRADVMLAGVVIFEAMMRTFEFGQLKVSTRGLRFAALRELWEGGS